MRKLIASAVLGIACVLAAAGGVGAATISGNGSGSHNLVIQKSKTVGVTSQSNFANFSNIVSTSSSTGGNKASFNTGGDVSLGSGSANTKTSVVNVANTNTSTSGGSCCPCAQSDENTISGNGAWSSNKIVDTTKCVNKVEQANLANIYNGVVSVVSTGGNSASFNTGGDVSLGSGNATSEVNISNVANSNTSN